LACGLAVAGGYDYSKEITDAHERLGGPATETIMDFHNNLEGRRLADADPIEGDEVVLKRAKDKCADDVRKAIATGDTIFLDAMNANQDKREIGLLLRTNRPQPSPAGRQRRYARRTYASRSAPVR
jgi:hypothetical protein